MKKTRICACLMVAMLSFGTFVVPSQMIDSAITVEAASNYEDSVGKISAKCSSDSIELYWDALSSASSYKIEYKTDSGYQKAEYKLTKIKDGRIKASITGLSAKTEYTFKITPLKKSNEKYFSGKSSYVKTSTSEAYNYSASVSTVSSTSTPKSISLSFAAVDGAYTYRVYQKNSSGKYDKVNCKLTSNNNKITAKIDRLNSNTKYTFKICPVAKKGSSYYEGKAKLVSAYTSAAKKAVAPAGNDTQGYGSVSGNITYKYNDFKGHVGDTGADVFLIPVDISDGSLDFFLTSNLEGTGVLTTSVDGTGSYRFDHVPAKEYAILVVSQNTNDGLAFSMGNDTWNDMISTDVDIKVDGEVDIEIMTVFKKYETDTITVYKNENTNYSYDFGITYI